MTNEQQQPAEQGIIEHFLMLFSSGRTDEAMDCLAEDARWWVGGKISGISGTYSRDEMKALLRQVRDAYQEKCLHIQPLAWTIAGERVALEAVSRATLLDGRVYNNEYHFLFRLRGSDIVEVKEYSDTYHMYETFVAPPAAE